MTARSDDIIPKIVSGSKRSAMRKLVVFTRKRYRVHQRITRLVLHSWKQFMAQELGAGNKVYLDGFGTWKLTRRLRAGSYDNYITFKSARKLKQAVKEGMKI